MPNFGRMYASDSFFVNLGSVLLRFCAPITAPESSRILGVDLSYCKAHLSKEPGLEEMNSKGLHLRGTAQADQNSPLFYSKASARVYVVHSALPSGP